MNGHAPFETERDAKKEIPDDEKANVFGVVDGVVTQHEVEETGEVRDRNEDEIRDERGAATIINMRCWIM
jgi:hypothetical protein